MNARLALCTAFLVLVGCGGGGGKTEPASEGGPNHETTPSMESAAVDPATAATVNGTILFEGTAPAEDKINMSADPQCAGMHSDAVYTEKAVVKDGKLQWAFIYVKDGLGNRTFPTPTTAAVIDQKGCQYQPHVLGVMVNQPLDILNSDETLHNIHAQPTNSDQFNIGMPLKNMKQTKKFPAAEVMIPVKCDVHPWMSSYIGVLTHPYFAVSGADGNFSIQGLPPGTYTLEAWHEKFGVQTQQVVVGPSETKTADFTFRATS
jgi:hypothetical protein